MFGVELASRIGNMVTPEPPSIVMPGVTPAWRNVLNLRMAALKLAGDPAIAGNDAAMMHANAIHGHLAAIASHLSAQAEGA